jgi:hypothetical protein
MAESFTINEWCAARKISRAMWYELKKKKKTPRTHSAGVKQLISPQADADWIAERERETLEIEAA